MNLPVLTTAPTGGTSIIFTLGYLVVIGAAFYFIAIRPQKKQQKAHAAMQINGGILSAG